MATRFKIPVTYEVTELVEAEGNTLEEAIQYVKKHIDDIPIGEYDRIDVDSCRLEDGENGDASIENAANYINNYWNQHGELEICE